MKKSLFFFAYTLFTAIVALGQQTENGTIVFYREPQFQGSAVSIRVYKGEELLVRLRNNSYFELECAPGYYTFSHSRPGIAPLSFRVEAGQTYFVRLGLRIGMWSAIPEMLLVDPASASPAIASGQMRLITADLANPPRPSNRMGVVVASGFGFKNHPIFIIEGGDYSKISLGGGVAFGLKYGREITKNFDLSTEINYMFSSLRPHLSNASVTFSRGIISITPSLIIPIRDGEEMRVKIGTGLDFYFGSSLKLEGRRVPGGFNDTWKYKSAFGPHLNAIFEMSLSGKYSLVYGMKLYSVRHNFDSFGLISPARSFPDLRETTGAGIDLAIGCFYHF